MSSTNPYTPPRAEVADMSGPYEGEFQRMTFWGWRGRVGRLRFLAYSSLAYVVFALALAVVSAVGGAMSGGDASSGAMAAVGVGTLVLLVPYLVFVVLVTIRRTHDMGWSGWMTLLVFIPLVSLIWVFKAGTPGANAYGPPPPPNTLGVKISAFGLLAIAVLGALAAISLPAYQNYVMRAQAAQGAR